MNKPNEILPEEALNMEPLNRFKFREAKILYDGQQMSTEWLVRCGHQSLKEHVGYGPTLEEAIFNAGIDARGAFTD